MIEPLGRILAKLKPDLRGRQNPVRWSVKPNQFLGTAGRTALAGIPRASKRYKERAPGITICRRGTTDGVIRRCYPSMAGKNCKGT